MGARYDCPTCGQETFTDLKRCHEPCYHEDENEQLRSQVSELNEHVRVLSAALEFYAVGGLGQRARTALERVKEGEK